MRLEAHEIVNNFGNENKTYFPSFKIFVVVVQTIVTFMQLMMVLPADFQKIKLIQP